jgi:NIPSNAP
MMPTPIMKSTFVTIASASLLLSGAVQGQPARTSDASFYEMRTYYAPPGKLDDLNARFRDHTLKIFEKHGMRNIGYWVPVENPENKLIYVLSFPSRQACEQSWKEFFADPEWLQAQKASEVNGKLVAKIESVFLKTTDFSPAIKAASGGEPRLFELRTYTAAPDKLGDLNRRFRDKTIGLFARHDITSIAYWTPVDKAHGADNTLIYIVAHRDKPAAEANWKAFREDADWITAKRLSETGGPLTVTNGVKSVYMKATDYSPIK